MTPCLTSPHVADPVYLNGRFLPLAEASVSPLDRGFLYGDGVYEVIPVYSRRAFRIDEHLGRLQATLNGIALPNPLSLAAWRAVVEQLIAAAPWDDQSIYLQVTRGADDRVRLRRPAGDAGCSDPGAGRRGNQRARPALVALRPQGHLLAAQCAG